MMINPDLEKIILEKSVSLTEKPIDDPDVPYPAPAEISPVDFSSTEIFITFKITNNYGISRKKSTKI